MTGKVEKRITGPNNVERVIWAVSKFFFFPFFHALFLLTNYLLDEIPDKDGGDEGKHVVWAISKSFFFRVFLTN